MSTEPTNESAAPPETHGGRQQSQKSKAVPEAPVAERLRWGISQVRRMIRTARSRAELSNALQALPAELGEPLTYLRARKLLDHRDDAVANKVESIRARIADRPSQVPIYYSPVPGSSGQDHSAEARPGHGQVLMFDFKRIASQTSVSPYWGRFLYLAAKARQARSILELGACAGVSGAYLASATWVDRFVSVEASPELASIAQQSLAEVNPNARVINALFDDALDELLPTYDHDLDLAWIDGHHERTATIHYFERLTPAFSPGAWVLFDDISWSDDMRAAWMMVSEHAGVSHAVDLGKCGLIVWRAGSPGAIKVDLRGVTGVGFATGRPLGWERDLT